MLPFSHCEHVLLEKSEEKTSEEHTSEVFSPSGSRAPLHRGFPMAEHGLPPVTPDGCERNEGRVQAVLSEPSPHGLKRPEPPAILMPTARADNSLSKACGTHENCIKQNQTTQRSHHLPARLFVPKFHRLPRSQTDVPAWTGDHVTALSCRVRTSKREAVSRLNHTDDCRRQPRPRTSLRPVPHLSKLCKGHAGWRVYSPGWISGQGHTASQLEYSQDWTQDGWLKAQSSFSLDPATSHDL